MQFRKLKETGQAISNLLLGKYEETEFDRRFFSAIVFITFLVSIYATVINIILKLNTPITLSTGISAMVFLGIYYAIRWGSDLDRTRIIAIIIACVAFSMFWFFNAGSKGPVIFLFFVFFLYVLFVMKGKALLLLLTLIALNITALYVVEYYHPDWVTGYDTEFARIFDLYFGTVMFFVVGGVIIFFAKLNYTREKNKAENSDRLKSSFLANLSHEIRTPMNSIIGFSQLLQKQELAKEKRERYLKLLNENSKYLLQLIEDIIDISIIDSQQIKLASKHTNLSMLLNKLYVNFRQVLDDMDKHQIKLSLEIPEESLVTETDEVRLEQVLRNILFNSVKFTHRGEIKFGYRLIKDKLYFFVSDTGIGIKNKHLKEIFNRFMKIEDENYRVVFRGAGIGLSLCKDLVRLLGGTIWAESKYGEGSVFSFTIPYKEVKATISFHETTKESASNLNWSGKMILIAEDEESNFEYLKELLDGTKIRIEWAKNGNEAIEITRVSKPDLILMDIKMPNINGLEATRIIRGFNQAIPIIAQTAHAFENDKQKCIEAGCNEYICKPIDATKALDLLKKYLN
ncbi:MAG: response regulator [Bacteroidales bacterium]|nr:response regulator [Bacteroidales bacterium]